MPAAGRDALIGSWRLLSFELQSPDGSIAYPFGRRPIGYLFYNDQGYMSAAFMGEDRARPDSDDLTETAKGDRRGRWTTVLAAAILLP